MRDVTDLLTEAAPGPTSEVDPDEVWTGGRTRRRRRHVLGAVIGFVGIIGASLGGLQLLTTDRAPTPVVDDPAPTVAPSPPVGEVAFAGPTVVLDGWRTVEAFGVALSVPPGWAIEELGEPGLLCQLTARPQTVYIEDVATPSTCELPGEGPFLVLQRWPMGGSPELPGYEFGAVTLSGEQASRSWDLTTPDQVIEATRIRWTDADVVATAYGPRGVTVEALAPLDRVVEGLRRAGSKDCPAATCAAPSVSTEAAFLDVELTEGTDRLGDISYRVVNGTDKDLEGGTAWHAERWDGTTWRDHDVATVWDLIGLTFPAGETSDPYHASLPARPGYYRIVKTMDGATLYSEVVRVVMSEDDLPDNTPGEAVDLASPRPVANSPDVAERSGAAARFVSCAGPLHLGGWAPDFGGPSGAGGPEEALQQFVDSGPFQLPLDGYRPVAKDDGRVLFTYDVDGDAKVAVIVGDAADGVELSPPGTGWGVEVFATCDPAEYDQATTDAQGRTIWTDADGNRVPSSTLTSYPGPSHCNWQSVTFLRLDDRQYLRDPRGVLRESTVADYEPSTELPTDARDTGYRDGDRELWLAGDESIAYVVTDDAVEAWPATTRMIGCM